MPTPTEYISNYTSAQIDDAVEAVQEAAFVGEDEGVGGVAAGTSLSNLIDTNIVNPSNGQILKYNSTSGKWENVSAVTIYSGSSAPSSSLGSNGDIYIKTS